MLIIGAVLLYLVFSLAAAILFGKFLRRGLHDDDRGIDIFKSGIVARVPRAFPSDHLRRAG